MSDDNVTPTGDGDEAGTSQLSDGSVDEQKFNEQMEQFRKTYEQITDQSQRFQVLSAELKNVKKVADATIQ